MNEFCMLQIYAEWQPQCFEINFMRWQFQQHSAQHRTHSHSHTKRTEANDDVIFCCRYCDCHCSCDCYLCCRHWYCFIIVFIHSSWRRRRSFLNVAYMHCAPLSDNNLGLTTLWCLIYKRILPAADWKVVVSLHLSCFIRKEGRIRRIICRKSFVWAMILTVGCIVWRNIFCPEQWFRGQCWPIITLYSEEIVSFVTVFFPHFNI